jgi:hypothetical protein
MNSDDVTKKKRGRKPKNVVETIINETIINDTIINDTIINDTIINDTIINDTIINDTNQDEVLESIDEFETYLIQDGNSIIDADSTDVNAYIEEQQIKLPKKRGRKPKGGKIIDNLMLEEINIIHEPNIILHLKCKFSDLNQSALNYDYKGVDSFQFEKSKGSELGYHVIENNVISTHDSSGSNYDNDVKNISNKIKNMSYNLQHNNISDKKSDCFWCTCSFDNPPIYIPKHQINNIYQCYGCFCSPECATAFLFKESIDTSTRFERYYLLNHIYNKVFNYTKNVKPAPDPFYTLNKYYGTLTIQEYRRLFKSERLLIVVDKPLSRVLPELHEYNDDIMLNENIQTTGKYTIKRKTKQKKTDILNEAFNIQ